MTVDSKKCSVSSPVVTLTIVAALTIACAMCGVLESGYLSDYPDYGGNEYDDVDHSIDYSYHRRSDDPPTCDGKLKGCRYGARQWSCTKKCNSTHSCILVKDTPARNLWIKCENGDPTTCEDDSCICFQAKHLTCTPD